MSRPSSKTSGRKEGSASHLRVADEWVGGRVQMPAYVMEGAPFRPDVVLWLDATNDLVVGHDVVPPDAPREVAVDLLLRTFEQPMAGRPRRPARIRVADAELAALVRERAGDIPVEVAPAPELDGWLAEFSKSVGRSGDDRSYLEGGKVAAQTVARFFAAAAKLYRAAPWRHVYDAHLIRLDSPDFSMRERCVSIIGAIGESFGLLIFDSVAGFETMAEHGEALLAGEDRGLGTSVFAINFERGSDLPKTMRREVAQHGWEVADANGYPLIDWRDADGLARPLTDRDVDFATACAEAVTAFFMKHGQAFADGTFSSARETFGIESLPGKPTVEVVAPHPDADWPDDDDDDDSDDLDYDAALEAEVARGGELAEAFFAAQRRSGRDDAWLHAASFVVEGMYEFKIRYADGVADDWTASLVEDYLLDYFPRKVSADEELITLVPEIADAFFAWLGDEGHLGARSAQAIRKRIAQKARAFVRAATDPDNFGMAKSIVMEMRSAGVDFSDQAQINRYLGELNAKMLAGAPPPRLSLPMAPVELTELERPPAKARWTWVGQGEAPDPKAPCPCGSGKRFKKCCLRR